MSEQDVEWKVVIVGRTGDGKSALCNSIVRSLGVADDPFVESSGANSHTGLLQSFQVGTLQVSDTPGLMDSAGLEQDETNIRLIVQDLRAGSYINAFILVINEQAPRFDGGMQDAVKLVVDSFGPGCLGHVGLVFTKAYGQVTAAEAQQKAGEIIDIINNRTHFTAPHIPVWQVDCHPERLAAIGVPEELIAARAQATAVALTGISQWVRSKERFKTNDATAAGYKCMQNFVALAALH